MDSKQFTLSLGKYFSKISFAISESAPQIIGTIFFVLIGLLVARLFQYLTVKLISSLDFLFKRVAGASMANQSRLKGLYALIFGRVVFWSVFVFFVYAGAEIFKWTFMSKSLWILMSYLPNIVLIIMILLGGYLFGSFIKKSISQTLALGKDKTDTFPLGTVAQLSIMVVVSIMAIEQLGINVSLLTQITLLALTVFLGGGILTFSLAARSVTENVIGAQYAKKYFQIGKIIKIGEVEGEIVDINQTSIVIETPDGVCLLPAKHVQQEITYIKNINHE
jgi:small-conductance mechanosensitive channel